MNRHAFRRPPPPALPALALPIALLLLPAADAAGQATELSQGQTVRRTLAAGDTARYTVEVEEDWFLFGEVDQVSVDVAVRVLGPEGAPVARADGLGRGGERFAGPLEGAGVYTIEVIADDAQSGEYAITLHRLESVAEDPEDFVDQLMARWDGDVPGGAVRVWRDGRTLFSKTYGMANLAYGIPFEPDTRTNIGSTSKQFTAFAVMLLADRGTLSLDDDIREHIPELPAFEHTVRVRHLLTHTSGLREFLNLLRMAGRRLDRGDWIDRSELIDIVRNQPALQNEPGAEWNYNNTAFGLAALIVERASGQPFHGFMHENVFEPLGMTRTMVRPSPVHIVPERSEGYTPGPDGYLEIGDLGGAVGAGTVYTTIEDLQTWVENYRDPRVGNAAIVEAMMTSYVLVDGEETGYGYGLSVDEQGGHKRVHHGGADVAHRSMLVYYPELGAGVTVQSNNARFGSSVAFRIAEKFFQELEEEQPAVAEAAAPAEEAADGGAWEPGAEELEEFAGRYFSREIETFYTLMVEDDGLVLHHRRMADATLEPGKKDRFSGGGFDFAFERDRNGRIIGFYLANGRTRDVRFQRDF